ncbi:uncharacterized protein [Arachis hypogaea]|uniref:uncharacterized protein isoform X2 n=1 Tax=Arachis hypogaea TaxID=3818 RepID=UPI003B218569
MALIHRTEDNLEASSRGMLRPAKKPNEWPCRMLLPLQRLEWKALRQAFSSSRQRNKTLWNFLLNSPLGCLMRKESFLVLLAAQFRYGKMVLLLSNPPQIYGLQSVQL